MSGFGEGKGEAEGDRSCAEGDSSCGAMVDEACATMLQRTHPGWRALADDDEGVGYARSVILRADVDDRGVASSYEEEG